MTDSLLSNTYLRRLERLEQVTALDGPSRRVEPFARVLVDRRVTKRFFHGDAIGIPLHVALTDVTFGGWFMAMYLDLFTDPTCQRSARRLMGLGVLSAVPTAVAGWAEWALADERTRRVGIVHAGLNLATTAVFAASWTARVRDRQVLGVRLARAGAVTAAAAGLLGGHMSNRRRGA